VAGVLPAREPECCIVRVAYFIYPRTQVVFTPQECRFYAAECEKMAAGTPNPRVQTILKDMARTWTRLALAGEQTRKERAPLQLIDPNPLPPPAGRQAHQGIGI